MRRLKYLLDRRSFEVIHFAFIRPVLEYSDVVWDNCSNYENEEMKRHSMTLQEL
jgi:hypothetical protein